MDLDFVLLADGVGRARMASSISTARVGTRSSLVPVPAVHPRLTLAVRLLLWRNKTAHPHRLELIIQAADGQEVARGKVTVDLPPETEAEPEHHTG